MSETSTPRVSVLMPVYNEVGRVRRALDSVLQQSFRDLEVIVVDDGSTDGTAVVLRSFVADGRVRVISLDHNQGLVAALNLGLAACRAPLVARMDADDVSSPTRVERQVAVFDDHPETTICATAYERRSAEGDFIRLGVPPMTHAALAVAMLAGNRIQHTSVMFDRERALEVGGYDERWFPVEDYDLWLRMLPAGVYRGLPTPEVSYTVNPEGISATRADEQRRVAIDRAIAYCVELTGTTSRVAGESELPLGDLLRAVRVLRRRLSSSGIPTTGLDRQALVLANASRRTDPRSVRAGRIFMASPRIAIMGRLRRDTSTLPTPTPLAPRSR